MVGAITFHAIDRLGQRRGMTHLVRHINKIRKWGLPDDGITEHKRWRYVTRGGVLITILPPKKGERKEK